jgi:hypothetical protein
VSGFEDWTRSAETNGFNGFEGYDTTPELTTDADYSGVFDQDTNMQQSLGDSPYDSSVQAQNWEKSWWNDSSFTDTQSPLANTDLPDAKWEPNLLNGRGLDSAPVTSADGITTYEQDLPYEIPDEFKDKLGQSGSWSYDIDITQGPAHFATEFNADLASDIVVEQPSGVNMTGNGIATNPWSPDAVQTERAIDIGGLSEGFGTTQTAVSGLPPIFTTWGQTTFGFR